MAEPQVFAQTSEPDPMELLEYRNGELRRDRDQWRALAERRHVELTDARAALARAEQATADARRAARKVSESDSVLGNARRDLAKFVEARGNAAVELAQLSAGGALAQLVERADRATQWINGLVSKVEEQRVEMAQLMATEALAAGVPAAPPRPHIVCLCGSTRFSEAFQAANLSETLAGRIVLSIGCNMRSDTEIFGHLDEAELTRIKTELDELHKRKIDLADEVLVLNVGGYIGDSTRSEVAYAQALGKPIRWLEPESDVPAASEPEVKP